MASVGVLVLVVLLLCLGFGANRFSGLGLLDEGGFFGIGPTGLKTQAKGLGLG